MTAPPKLQSESGRLHNWERMHLSGQETAERFFSRFSPPRPGDGMMGIPPRAVNSPKGLVLRERPWNGLGAHIFGITALPTIPERVETPILIMISLKNAFTVLGLMTIRSAISLFFSPSSK